MNGDNVIDDGSGGGNYTVSTIADTTGVIDPLAITVSAAPGSNST